MRRRFDADGEMVPTKGKASKAIWYYEQLETSHPNDEEFWLELLVSL